MRGIRCENQSGVEMEAEPVKLEDMKGAPGELTRNQYQGWCRLNVFGIQQHIRTRVSYDTDARSGGDNPLSIMALTSITAISL